MKKFLELQNKLKKIGGNIILTKTPGYDYYFEEFCKNVWRINIFVDMDSLSLNELIKIKGLVKKIYGEYNIILSAWRFNTLEYWTGNRSDKNILLHIVPFTNFMKRRNVWTATDLIQNEVICGRNFVQELMLQKYRWTDFIDVTAYDYVPAYIFLKDDIPEFFKMGMLKAYFLKMIVSTAYCKGKLPYNQERVISFFKEKFNDKKMIRIIENFYDNTYKRIDAAIADVIYFVNKVRYWKGIQIFQD